MSTSILVGYATRSGSTQEVAEAVAATLREGGFAVDVESLQRVKTVEKYSAVVVGAPLFMFRWHRDAMGFLARFREGLLAKPVAVFSLGPFHDEEEEWKGAREQLDKELAKLAWLAPVTREVFGGKFDPATLRFPFSLLPALKRLPASDIRDWTAIRAWASSLPAKLKSA